VTRSLLVLIALASLAHANPGKPDGEDAPPKVTRTQLTLQLGKAKPAKALVEHADVVPDFRPPDIVRLGISPLYTRFQDVHEAMDRLRTLVAEGVHERMDPTPGRVT